MGMEPDELDGFLGRAPALLGFVGNSFADGSPHVVPVWYRWNGSEITIWTGEKRPWVRNLSHDPRVSIVVAEQVPPFAGLVMQGRMEVRTADDETTAMEIRRICRRYLPDDDVEGYVDGFPNLRTIARLRPDSVRSWVRGY